MSTEIAIAEKQRISLNQLKTKCVNLFIFGHGNVGGNLLDQVLEGLEVIAERKRIQLRIVAIVNSRKAIISAEGIRGDWRKRLETNGTNWDIGQIIDFARSHTLNNCIAVDNTASRQFVDNYSALIAGGFHLVSSNKIGNTLELGFYKQLRQLLENHDREYLYETNVGAGLPLIDTIKLLHLSGENITRIRGIFSGSLSYIFNTFSEEEKSFSTIVRSAVTNGLTEPDPREDLCGNDVGRKLLILARELDLHNELEDVQIENLVPDFLRNVDASVFLDRLTELDPIFSEKKKNLKEGEVLRYVADLRGDLSVHDKAVLEVKLKSVSAEDALAQVSGSDSVFQIYTENYGSNPIVIKGAGAGGAVTARGVLGDILRLSEKLH